MLLTRTQFFVDLAVAIAFGIITLLTEADVFGGPNVRGFFRVIISSILFFTLGLGWRDYFSLHRSPLIVTL